MSPYGKLLLTVPGAPDQEFLLSKPEITLGRATINDISVADTRLSRFHARINCGPAGCSLVDLRSANGTFLNGSRIDAAVPLAPGDRFQVGGSSFVFLPAATELGDEDLTQIASEQELEFTLERSALPMALNDTAQPTLVVHAPDRTWDLPLADDALEIGRSQTNGLVLDYARVSRWHARIERRKDVFILRDLGSTNGTWLGEQRIDERQLQSGDTFQVGPVQMVFKAAFTQEELTHAESFQGQAPGKNPVVFIPGIMGSNLWQGSEQVWPNVKYLIRHPELYTYQEDTNLTARGIVNEIVIVPNLIKQEQYSRMGDYLVEELGYVRGETLLEFAYDWRQDVRLSARKLAEAIDAWHAPRPITLIAHSLGTLVSRYYVERLGGKAAIGRMILMGGPHSGAPKIASNLLSGLKLLPFGIMGDRLSQVIASFPSCYQILPTYACTRDEKGEAVNLLEDESWVQERYRPLLHSAQEFRRELGNRSSVPAISIFGYGLKTITDLRVHRGAHGRWTGATFEVTPKGDSTVPERSAVLEGTEIHPVQQYHGTLFVDADVRMRLKIELLRDTLTA